MSILGIKRIRTASYHPQSNGLVERFHRQLKASLAATVQDRSDWTTTLPLALLGIRTSLKEDFGHSSAELLRTRKHVTNDRHGKSDVIAIDRVKPAYLLRPDSTATNTVSVSPRPAPKENVQSCKKKRALCRPNRGTIAGYFLADRLMWWLPVGASLFASNIGSEHFIGMASSGAASGIGIGAFNFNSIILLQLMSWVFLPVFIASKVRTVPEYMHKRFGGQRIQMYLAVLSLLLYIFTKISVDLYSGSIFINQALKWDIYWSMTGLLVLTALFTVTGGLAAVIYTDTLQVIIMLAGALFVMIKAFQEVGGYGALQYKYMQAVPKLTYKNTSCGLPRDDSWIMLRDPVNSDLPWPAFLLGQTPASIWYWCADQNKEEY
ncbi:sodium/myo-inositol cotransporter-like [Eriocheir sinensis]|uniref:sodium/myo-inositol cotransporter-like n=1 Tax=Eriocheir sinensis TaxID=95602 RepID=UPI0021C60709|nr:sodium/myo-inositol cotransporter-like [Eriocheir sinensis]